MDTKKNYDAFPPSTPCHPTQKHALAVPPELWAPAKPTQLSSPSSMIIYRDLIAHDEMFSDIYKTQEIAEGCVPGGRREDSQ